MITEQNLNKIADLIIGIIPVEDGFQICKLLWYPHRKEWVPKNKFGPVFKTAAEAQLIVGIMGVVKIGVMADAEISQLVKMILQTNPPSPEPQ